MNEKEIIPTKIVVPKVITPNKPEVKKPTPVVVKSATPPVVNKPMPKVTPRPMKPVEYTKPDFKQEYKPEFKMDPIDEEEPVLDIPDPNRKRATYDFSPKEYAKPVHKAYYSCMELCGREDPCGNTYCSNHPKYIRPVKKSKKKKK